MRNLLGYAFTRCMRDHHPSRLLLLPDRHHANGLRGQRMSREIPVRTPRIGDHKSVAIQFDLEVAKGIIIELQLLEALQCAGAIEAPMRCYCHVSSADVPLEFVPVLVVDLLPETAFQALASSSLRPRIDRRFFMPYRAGCKRDQEKEKATRGDQSIHAGILS